MAHIVSLLILILTVFSSFPIALAQDSPRKPTIAIVSFPNPANYYDSTIGNGLTDLFISELMKTDLYRIVERDGLPELIDEIDLGQSDYAHPNSAIPKGLFEGAEYLLLTKVTNFGETERTYGGGLFLFGGVKKSEAYVRLDFRIVDATTREVIYTGYGDGLDKKSGVAIGGFSAGSGSSINISSRSFLQSRLGKATLKALNGLIGQMNQTLLNRRDSGAARARAYQQAVEGESLRATTGSVLAVVNNDTVIISIGSDQRLRAGDTLRVLRPNSVTDAKGNVVYTEEQEVALITITATQPDRSKAVLAAGGGINEGYVVRRQ